MKHLFWLALILLVSCKKEMETETVTENTKIAVDTVRPAEPSPADAEPPKEYANERFREVTVAKVGTDQYRVRGEGQIFEASFNWVVEDGHNELKNGYEMTDAGAPEWGKFDFTITVPKDDKNTVLTLILFEISAKDGSRQHELPIAL